MVYYDHQPSKIEAVGDGSYRYRWNIEEDEVTTHVTEDEGAPVETRVQWRCDEVIVPRLDSNVITEAVIAYGWSGSREQKLVNDYNSAQLGLFGAKTSETAKAKIAAYTEFLESRNALKEQVDADCEELGIL